MLALVAQYDLELHQLDVKTAFVHGDLDETIYMNQPDGFILPRNEEKVCMLKKSLYGLKQSPRQWYRKFHEYVLTIGFKRSLYDRCVYTKREEDHILAYLLLYVDDMLIVSKRYRKLIKSSKLKVPSLI